jgi:anti-sigma28 factor (negative regulator of flagellin synthesis)
MKRTHARSSVQVQNTTTQQAQDVEARRKASIAELKAQLHARSESEERHARIEELKTQVEAGTYRVESVALAQKILSLPYPYLTHLQDRSLDPVEVDHVENVVDGPEESK